MPVRAEGLVIRVNQPQLFAEPDVGEYLLGATVFQDLLLFGFELLGGSLVLDFVDVEESFVHLFEDVFLDGDSAVGHDLLHLLFPIVEILVQAAHYFFGEVHSFLHRRRQTLDCLFNFFVEVVEVVDLVVDHGP